MNFTIPSFSIAIPEIFLLGMACIILLVDVFISERRGMVTYILTQLTLAVAFILVIMQYKQYPNPIITFNGHYVLDKFALVLKMAIYVMSFFAFAYTRVYLQERNIPRGEYYVLGLFSVIGMSVMASAYSLLSIYLSLELLSLTLYAMVALQKHSMVATEAAMKYFVMGALASGLLLYGISIVYGATGSIQILDISKLLETTSYGENMMVLLGLVFIMSGLIFKLGAVPFHMWVPDVYQGAPTCVTLFIASAPKIAAFGITMRILAEALPSFEVQWQQMLIAISVLSMFFGNVLAIAQTNIKRMLAYSSIAHIGYSLLGILAGPYSADGYSAAMFYIVTYVLVAAGAFAVVAILSKSGTEFERLEDYRGLNARNPWLAFMMLLFMFSMAGVPPTVGFFAKLGLLEALIEAHLVWLAAIALLFAIIGAYYYLRVVMLMYFEEPAKEFVGQKIKMSLDRMIAITLNGMAALILGLLPSGLIDLCRVSLA